MFQQPHPSLFSRHDVSEGSRNATLVIYNYFFKLGAVFEPTYGEQPDFRKSFSGR